jgi:cell division septal protein FtsQ
MRKRTYVLWKKIVTRLFVLALVCGAFYVYFRTGLFTIKDYRIIGAPDTYAETLKENAVELANQKIYKLLPGNRIMSYHKIDLAERILSILPNTNLVSIYPSGLHTITIKIRPYTPVFAIDDTHAIAQDGTIYKEINPLTDFPRLELATSTTVNSTTLSQITTLSKNIETVLFPVRTIAIDTHEDVKLYSASGTAYITYSLDEDMAKVWSNILSAIDTDPLKKNLATDAHGLEYIDARFGNKIFYKFTKGVAPAIIPDTDTHATDSPTTTLR